MPTPARNPRTKKTHPPTHINPARAAAGSRSAASPHSPGCEREVPGWDGGVFIQIVRLLGREGPGGRGGCDWRGAGTIDRLSCVAAAAGHLGGTRRAQGGRGGRATLIGAARSGGSQESATPRRARSRSAGLPAAALHLRTIEQFSHLCATGICSHGRKRGCAGRVASVLAAVLTTRHARARAGRRPPPVRPVPLPPPSPSPPHSSTHTGPLRTPLPGSALSPARSAPGPVRQGSSSPLRPSAASDPLSQSLERRPTRKD